MRVGYQSDPYFPFYLQKIENSSTLKSGTKYIWKEEMFSGMVWGFPPYLNDMEIKLYLID